LMDPTLTATNVDNVSHNPPLDNLGVINNRYEPWGGNPLGRSSPSMPKTQIAAKDPLVFRSDDWDFPTNKYPNIGWLGRVHRGTPWQSIYLKSPNILFQPGAKPVDNLVTWQKWTGNPQFVVNWGQLLPSVLPLYTKTNIAMADALFSLPTNDWRIL